MNLKGHKANQTAKTAQAGPANTGTLRSPQSGPVAGPYKNALFDLRPNEVQVSTANDIAKMLGDLMHQTLPTDPLARHIAVEAIFQGVNHEINRALDECQKGAIREILQRIHDHVDGRIEAVRIISDLEEDDDRTARYAPAFQFGIQEDGELEFEDASNMDGVFQARGLDDPRDALRDICFLGLNDLDGTEIRLDDTDGAPGQP